MKLNLEISKNLFHFFALSALLLLLFSSEPALCANDTINQTMSSGQESNVTDYNFNETMNATAYQCQGASKEDLKIYDALAWWMDAVCQVMGSIL